MTAPYNTAMPEQFLSAWKRAVALAGFEYFGDGSPAGCALAADKNDLRPRWDRIESAFSSLDDEQQVYLAHLLTFYNSELGGWPISKYLSRLENPSLGHASAVLDEARRAALAEVTVTYCGW